MDNYLCVIPARGGSTGIPRKNLRTVAGKPLLVWSIEHALEAGPTVRVIVSTDDEEIATVAQAAGAEVPFIRPPELATDAAATDPVLVHAVTMLAPPAPPRAVVLLQPTSPIRERGAVARAIALFESSGCDSLVSVQRISPFRWRDSPTRPEYDILQRPRRQDFSSSHFLENGSIYVTDTSLLLGTGCRLGGEISLFEMSAIESIDIDAPEDLLIADRWLSSKQ